LYSAKEMNGMMSHNITHGIYSQNRTRTALHRIVWRRAPHLIFI